MYRNLIQKLVKWRDSSNRKPLILQGARQVGKTWLMKEFGALYFNRVAYFMFEKNKTLQDVFAEDMNTDRILEALSLLAGFKISQDDLIIFDEIQSCPDAITSLKFFCEEKRNFHIIGAGSLLGVALHKGVSFPVGKVKTLTLNPLSFHEFLDAVGEREKCQAIAEGKFSLLKPLHNDLLAWVKRYMYIGGMPEVVADYVENRDFTSVRQLQNEILNNYQKDFSKHIPKEELAKVQMVWKSIPSQLAKDNQKFIYGAIKHGARAKDFENAIAWLESCGLIHKIHRVKKPAFPLSAYTDLSAFKLFMSDVGLLSAMSHLDAKILLGKTDLFEEFKGALTEQYVLQQLLASEKDLDVHYWTNDTSTSEIDFVVQSENEILPIEVKAGINLKAKSLAVFIDKFAIAHAKRYSAADYKQNEIITDIPLYACP